MLRRQPIQLLQYFTTKLAFSTQCPQYHKDKLRKQLKQLLQQVTTLRQDIASSRPKVACSETTFTTLRLAHNLTHFLHSIVRLAMCPREAVPFHGTLSRHGITWASSVLRMSPQSCCILLFTLQKACYTRSVCFVPAKRLFIVVNVVFCCFPSSAGA